MVALSSLVPKAGLVSVAVALLIVALVVMIIFIIYHLRKSDLRRQVLIDRPLHLSDEVGKPSSKIILDSTFTTPTLGREFSYTFWIFLSDYADTGTNQKVLWYRSKNAQAYNIAHPIFTMHPKTNKLSCFVGTNETPTTTMPSESSHAGFMHLMIDYVPLQRWVMVSLVVKDRIATLYLDDTIYTTKSVEHTPGPSPRAIIRSPNSGSVFVGRDKESTPTINGYIARFSYYNFALTQRHVQSTFSQGPSKPSILTSLGLPAYGIRSPVYRIDATPL